MKKEKVRIPIARKPNKTMASRKDYRRQPKYRPPAKTNWLDPDLYWE